MTVLFLMPKLVCLGVIQIFVHETEFYALFFFFENRLFSYAYKYTAKD